MNNPAVQSTNGVAHFFSRLYRPGEMNPHTCINTHGEARKTETSNGSFK